MSVISINTLAHSPFLAPQSYWAHGANTPILAGFAEKPFDSEVAIRGFELSAVLPNGEMKALSLTNSKTISVADLNIEQSGTYEILGERSSPLRYVKVDKRWLRVLDARGTQLPPLEKRPFITEGEYSDQNEQITVNRDDQIVSYLSKSETSALKNKKNSQGLVLDYSVHPNLLNTQKPLLLKVNLNQKPVVGYSVNVEKKLDALVSNKDSVNLKTNALGEVSITFKSAGEYIVTITSPETVINEKPQAQQYRTIVSLFVKS